LDKLPHNKNLRLLFLGDIVGEPGRKAVAAFIPKLREERSIDFIVVNGENSAGGRGITPKIAIGLLRAGATVITTGDHIWDKTPGNGSVVLESDKGPVAIMNAQGRTFMNPPLENPLIAIDEELEKIKNEYDIKMVFLDFHAEATSEKIATARYLDGRVSAVVGTHTHVQTADEQILPKGTAFLCDAGMCGPKESILGRRVEPILHRMKTSMPQTMPVAKGPVEIRGVLVDIDTTSGKAVDIERIAEIMD
jgi:calcineurin-like phosphoesterase